MLKNRITGGAGHLSNRQCAEAVARIAPREHVVLLHLSRDCNRPELAAAAHAGASYRLTVASQESPTARICVAGESSVPAHA
jgi:phosphoribosyl 1,2-cyclic phosphodiesterase